MTAVDAIFPFGPALSPTREGQKSIIETVGVEVVEVLEGQAPADVASRAPANGNGVIPFASTLRRIG